MSNPNVISRADEDGSMVLRTTETLSVAFQREAKLSMQSSL